MGLGLLVLAELLLRLAGFGGPGHRPDPFAGFSPTEPLFVRTTGPGGEELLATRPDRVGPFNLQSFPRRKEPGTVRIFCLGGSSTFGFPYDDQLSFCGAVRRGLERLAPERKFEVVNCGGMSYGARRVLNVMRELVAYEPDAFLVYTGHNEYVERRFFARFLEEPAWRRRLRGVLNRLRLYVAARRVLDPLTHREEQMSEDPFGVAGPVRDDSRRQPRDAREDALVAEQFRFALDEMRALATRSDSSLLLVLPAANLRTWAPEGSAWRSDLGADRQRARDAAVAAAGSLLAAGRPRQALDAADQALALDQGPAVLHYLRGQALLQLDRPEAADALGRARDLDTVPIRITGPVAGIIRDTWESGDLEPLDADAALARVSPHGIVGSEMVLDYCHPSPEGHRRIAALILPSLRAQFLPEHGGPTPGPADLLPPAGEGADAAASAFGAAWAGQMLVRQGRAAEAEPLFRRALSLDPGLATAHEGLGRILAASGRPQEAVEELETAARLAPEMSNVWNNLGQAYRAAGRLEEALAAYGRAAATGVGAGVVRRNMAATLLQQGRPEEALQEAREACRLSPGDAQAWVQLGRVQAALGLVTDAREAFLRALELDPAAAGARPALESLSGPPGTP